MTKDTYIYRFSPETNMRDVEEALLLSAAAAEGLHGRSLVQLDASFQCDMTARRASVDASSEVGSAISRIFTALLATTIGEPAFRVERIRQAA